MIKLDLDLSELFALKDLKDSARTAAEKALRNLTMMTHGYIKQEVDKRLKSRRQAYQDALGIYPINSSTWVVNLDAKARWIEDGKPPGSMIDDLLKPKEGKKIRKAPDGSRYVIVPFKHGPNMGPTTTTSAQQDLISTVKAEMKSRGIPFAKIERDAAGQAKLGKLHSFSITGAPLKTANAPGQGKGPIGQPRQGPTGIPFLKGVSVYQKLQTPKGGGPPEIKRAIMTFRIASSRHKDEGRWEHPGLDPVHIFEDALKWAEKEWEEKVAPQLVDDIIRGI